MLLFLLFSVVYSLQTIPRGALLGTLLDAGTLVLTGFLRFVLVFDWMDTLVGYDGWMDGWAGVTGLDQIDDDDDLIIGLVFSDYGALSTYYTRYEYKQSKSSVTFYHVLFSIFPLWELCLDLLVGSLAKCFALQYCDAKESRRFCFPKGLSFGIVRITCRLAYFLPMSPSTRLFRS